MAAARPLPTANPGAEAGFTITELLVVMTLIGLLVMAAPALISAARPGVNATTTARALAGELRAARGIAATLGRQTEVVLDPDAGFYSVQPGGRAHRLAAGMALVLADSNRQDTGKAAVIRFFPDGSSSGGRVGVRSGNSVRWITVHWLSGKVVVDE